MFKKITLIVLIAFFALPLFAQVKISEMTRLDTPTDSIRFVVVFDSSGTNVSRQVIWWFAKDDIPDDVTLELSGGKIQIATAGITTTQMGTASVDTDELAADAVTTVKIIDDAVTAAKVDETGSYTVTDITATGTVTGAAYSGDGSGLSGIASGTGGITNAGSTTIIADNDANDVGQLVLQTSNITILTIEPDGNDQFIGIDDTSPDARLEIAETGEVPFMISNGAIGDGDFVIVETDGDVGIGIAAPLSQFHIVSSTSTGQTPSVQDDDFVIDSTNDPMGMSFLSANTARCDISFGDTDVANTGQIIYDHGGPFMDFKAEGVLGLRFKATEAVINDLSADFNFRIETDARPNIFFIDGADDCIGIGTSTFEAAAVLNIAIAEGTAPGGATADQGYIWTQDDGGTAEVYVQDGAGNQTKFSPHDENGDWVFYSINVETGDTVHVNMIKVIKTLEDIAGISLFEKHQKEGQNQKRKKKDLAETSATARLAVLEDRVQLLEIALVALVSGGAVAGGVVGIRKKKKVA